MQWRQLAVCARRMYRPFLGAQSGIDHLGGGGGRRYQQTVNGSFSAVSTPTSASKYAFFSIEFFSSPFLFLLFRIEIALKQQVDLLLNSRWKARHIAQVLSRSASLLFDQGGRPVARPLEPSAAAFAPGASPRSSLRGSGRRVSSMFCPTHC